MSELLPTLVDAAGPILALPLVIWVIYTTMIRPRTNADDAAESGVDQRIDHAVEKLETAHEKLIAEIDKRIVDLEERERDQAGLLEKAALALTFATARSWRMRELAMLWATDRAARDIVLASWNADGPVE